MSDAAQAYDYVEWSMDLFGQKMELVLLVVSTLASVLAVVVWLLNCQREQWSAINTLREEVGALKIDHQKTIISLERGIGELKRAKTVLIEKARRDKQRFRTLEQRVKALEIESANPKAHKPRSYIQL